LLALSYLPFPVDEEEESQEDEDDVDDDDDRDFNDGEDEDDDRDFNDGEEKKGLSSKSLNVEAFALPCFIHSPVEAALWAVDCLIVRISSLLKISFMVSIKMLNGCTLAKINFMTDPNFEWMYMYFGHDLFCMKDPRKGLHS